MGTEWMEVAIIVSIACAVFVALMFLAILCKRKDDDPLRGIRIDPDAHKSLASAHGDMSGTNHHHRGINYLIGSVDTNDDWDPNHVQIYANHLMKEEQAKNNLSLGSTSLSSSNS